MPAESTRKQPISRAREFMKRFQEISNAPTGQPESPLSESAGKAWDSQTHPELEWWVDPGRFMNPEDAPINTAASIEWVKARLSTPPAMVKPDDCPDGFTWRTYTRAVQDVDWFIEKVAGGLKKAAAQEDAERKPVVPLHVMEALDRIERGLEARQEVA